MVYLCNEPPEEATMPVLVVGATGATGKMLVGQLLNRKQTVRVIVRDADKLSEAYKSDPNLTITIGSPLELSESELAELVDGCDAVASCLGHNLTLKGLFGKPKKLVTDATKKLCNAIRSVDAKRPVKFVLMNTTGNQNRDIAEKYSIPEAIVMGLLRLLLPPQVDNEQAADYLRTQIGQNDSAIEWVAVRPDTLVDEEDLTDYELHASPTSSPIFRPGKTSRINVGCFMAELATNDGLWNTWKGQMPVIYNKQ